MTSVDIARQRLANQLLTRPSHGRPEDVVASLGAVQAQDYLGALWAVGLRLASAVEADVELSLANRAIVRTWPMRGTLHLVAAADVRWMLELMGSRTIERNARRLEQHYGLDAATIGRSQELFARALQGGKQLTRDAMYAVLRAGDLSPDEMRGLHLLGRAAHAGLICLGPRAGKQPTFVLLDEWLPRPKRLEREEALAELAQRYFTGHGPATLADLVWWSGLRAAEARAGLDLARSRLEHAVVDGRTYWFSPDQPDRPAVSPVTWFLPAYDEYLVGYRDRTAAGIEEFPLDGDPRNNPIFGPTVILDGRIVGTWKRTFVRDEVIIAPRLIAATGDAQRAFAAAAARYGAFVQRPVAFASE